MTPREAAKGLAQYANGTCDPGLVVYDGLCQDCLPFTTVAERAIRAAGAPLAEALRALLDCAENPQRRITFQIRDAKAALAAWEGKA